jgi:hypothetical protein
MTFLNCELMFDSKTKLTGRLTDAVDLLIDFATLGEYGLEPADGPTPPGAARRRPHAPVPSRRGGNRPLTARV